MKSQSQSGSNHGYRARRSKLRYHQQSFANRQRFSHAVTSPPAFNQGSVSCFYCNQSYFLSDCHGFISLSLDERRNFCNSQRLCFGCLCHGHSNRYCCKQMQCATCNRHHPTVFTTTTGKQSAITSQFRLLCLNTAGSPASILF